MRSEALLDGLVLALGLSNFDFLAVKITKLGHIEITK